MANALKNWAAQFLTANDLSTNASKPAIGQHESTEAPQSFTSRGHEMIQEQLRKEELVRDSDPCMPYNTLYNTR